MSQAAQPQTTARISEIFASVQGEGPWVGVRQLFVRFCGCNLDCAYCDAPEAKHANGQCRIETVPGSWQFTLRQDRFTEDELMQVLSEFGPSSLYHSVAVTGGEPLLHAPFHTGWFERLRAQGYRVYLETNGVLPEVMRRLGAVVNFCSMDIKLPSTSGERARWDANREFLAACRDLNVPTFVKIVVGHNTTAEELSEACRIVASTIPIAPVVLQPVTPHGSVSQSASVQHLLDLQRVALGIVADVRVIPQTHKMLGAL